MKRKNNIAQDHKDEVVHNMAQTLMLLSRSRTFECKTCFKKFSSFQALGGHRTSHKKPRLQGGDQHESARKMKVHECSICGLEFSVGQALGGHMRRHRDRLVEKRLEEKKLDLINLDLNFPPVDGDGDRRLLAFTLGLPAMVQA